MGISKSKTTTKSNETLAPSTYSQPFINDAASTLRPTYDQTQDILKRYMPQAERAVQFYGDTMDGKYLGKGNPYLENTLQDINQSTADGVNSQFSGAGRYGSGMHAKVLADRIGQNENNLRFGNYATERGYQDDAALRQGALIESTAGIPQNASGQYANAINALLGRYATSTGTNVSKSSPSLLQLLAQGGQSVASAFSGGG